jgi:hypothetical protein
MQTSTEIFLAYRKYRLDARNRLSFADYVTEKPDLAALILVSRFSDENGIGRPKRRGRKAKPR